MDKFLVEVLNPPEKANDNNKTMNSPAAPDNTKPAIWHWTQGLGGSAQHGHAELSVNSSVCKEQSGMACLWQASHLMDIISFTVTHVPMKGGSMGLQKGGGWNSSQGLGLHHWPLHAPPLSFGPGTAWELPPGTLPTSWEKLPQRWHKCITPRSDCTVACGPFVRAFSL